jgi:hypothetical protein
LRAQDRFPLINQRIAWKKPRLPKTPANNESHHPRHRLGLLRVRHSSGRKKQAPLVVHEWVTFTSLQDEQGNAIGGINTDDEPVRAGETEIDEARPEAAGVVLTGGIGCG